MTVTVVCAHELSHNYGSVSEYMTALSGLRASEDVDQVLQHVKQERSERNLNKAMIHSIEMKSTVQNMHERRSSQPIKHSRLSQNVLRGSYAG